MPNISTEARGATPFYFNAVVRLYEFSQEIDTRMSAETIDHYCSKFQGALMMILHTEIPKDFDSLLLVTRSVAEKLGMLADEEYLQVVVYIHTQKQKVHPA